MTQYKFTVGATPQSVIGNLTWNANGSLGSLAVTDPFNSANTQTCNYSHDDLSRIASVNCGSTVWTQNFSYDAFGNITKSVPTGGMGNSFQPTYNPATNRMTALPGFTPSYDANGNVMNDSFQQYTWDAEGRPVTIGTVGLTFDALGRMVEQNRLGTYTQIVYAPTGGKLALMSGTTLQKAFVPLPGGGTAVYNSTGLSYYRHADWLGSSRFASTPTTRAMYFDGAYAPFGEPYAQAGTTDLSFTGQNSDTAGGSYDFLFREYSTQGRWPSPDPAGLAAVTPGNPQSWNRYSYVLNSPTNGIDLYGLKRPPAFRQGGGFFPLLHFFFGGFGFGSLFGCQIDGVDSPCSMAFGLVQAGGAVPCPNNDCGFHNNGQPAASDNGQPAASDHVGMVLLPGGCTSASDSGGNTLPQQCDAPTWVPASSLAQDVPVGNDFIHAVSPQVWSGGNTTVKATAAATVAVAAVPVAGEVAVPVVGSPFVQYNAGQFVQSFGQTAVYGPLRLPPDITSPGGWLGWIAGVAAWWETE